MENNKIDLNKELQSFYASDVSDGYKEAVSKGLQNGSINKNNITKVFKNTGYKMKNETISPQVVSNTGNNISDMDKKVQESKIINKEKITNGLNYEFSKPKPKSFREIMGTSSTVGDLLGTNKEVGKFDFAPQQKTNETYGEKFSDTGSEIAKSANERNERFLDYMDKVDVKQSEINTETNKNISKAWKEGNYGDIGISILKGFGQSAKNYGLAAASLGKEGAGLIGDTIGEGVMLGADLITPDAVGDYAKGKLKEQWNKLPDEVQGEVINAIQKGGEYYAEWEKNNPELALVGGAVINMAGVVGLKKIGQSALKDGVTVAKDLGNKALSPIQTTKNTVKGIGTGVSRTKDIVGTGINKVKDTVLGTNKTEKSIQNIIDKLDSGKDESIGTIARVANNMLDKTIETAGSVKFGKGRSSESVESFKRIFLNDKKALESLKNTPTFGNYKKLVEDKLNKAQTIRNKVLKTEGDKTLIKTGDEGAVNFKDSLIQIRDMNKKGMNDSQKQTLAFVDELLDTDGNLIKDISLSDALEIRNKISEGINFQATDSKDINYNNILKDLRGSLNDNIQDNKIVGSQFKELDKVFTQGNRLKKNIDANLNALDDSSTKNITQSVFGKFKTKAQEAVPGSHPLTITRNVANAVSETTANAVARQKSITNVIKDITKKEDRIKFLKNLKDKGSIKTMKDNLSETAFKSYAKTIGKLSATAGLLEIRKAFVDYHNELKKEEQNTKK